MDSSLPGSSIHGIFQARVLEWTAISFSRGSSQPRDQTCVSCIADRCFTIWATRLLTSCQHMTTHAVLVHCCQHSGHWWSWATSVTIYLHDGNTPPPTWSCPPYMSLLQVPENIKPDFESDSMATSKLPFPPSFSFPMNQSFISLILPVFQHPSSFYPSSFFFLLLILMSKGSGARLTGPTSVQFSRSVVSESLWLQGLQHTRPTCPSLTPRVYPNSWPLSRWCHPTISSSVFPFSSRLQSFPASGSFPVSQFFASGDQSIGASASASVLPIRLHCSLVVLPWALCLDFIICQVELIVVSAS